ncbi:3-oxoacyl-[acyl-carrier-protein] synthase III C-terminal domain-containing protein [Microcoleus sp. FACHB-68]|uniref:3-oxoacyl-[acyl-carrier-protein] synthase III C-terminal domain-containing protein n=1 Tax=Microcoleus sp. FACHB-68 TaxID=2692826 RepID=UPI0016837604|nr:3-oxoacyl-[acyl-carrier-protein] synthase III C-terminal domain-containing protein [Microcoleus sp. FACHB-68]MBD1937137.1 3-oxoacyl-ACP synthase [Microcoleus sp. FACHB-68]
MYSAYINSIGKFLPGNPVSNDQMEDYLGKVGGRPSKVKNRILKSNGIQQRHYALDSQQNTTYLNSQMAAYAVRDALSQIDLEPAAIDLLACGTSWPDLLVPGFASMVHGELPEFSPLETLSSQGVCCAGVAALKYATSQVQLGTKRAAFAVASELASRLFKHTNFEAEEAIKSGQPLSFDTEFLRWMLSDGAGAVLIQNHPNATGISLKIEWIELISHANAYPVCMYAGVEDATAKKSWMDYPSYVAAATAGAINLRQNIRLLDKVIKLGVEGWLKLIELGRVRPEDIDWLLCHYSSHFFRGQIVELLEKAGCMIPEEKWFTNLYTRGNTGCASIYLMLEELFHSGKLQAGQKIFCFVPESGRFTTAYMMLSVVDASSGVGVAPVTSQAASTALFAGGKGESDMSANFSETTPLESIKLGNEESPQAYLLRELAQVWLGFERQIRSVPVVRKLHRGEFTIEDYKALLRNLRPQVVEGARWIARAASNMIDFRLRSTFIGHAQDEHRDYQMLERNYVSVGGALDEIVNAEKNIGSEALSAFIFHQASRDNPVDLIGSMFIIEGLGNQLAGQWAVQIKQTLGLRDEQVSFLAYHGTNDELHIGKLEALINAEWMTEEIARRIVKTAQVTARLYLLQLEEIR